MGRTSSKRGGRLTNTVVPRFNGGSCWQQHLQICQAIVKSNGWTDGTAALQLFAHLDGKTLNVALLMPEGERSNLEGLSQGLLDYYSWMLAVFRRQFEIAARRPGMDPATFATELEILAVRRFGDMGKRARNWMIRDRFIAAQWSCGLCRHLDSVLPDTPIRDIVDRCRVWESHSELKGSGSGVDVDQDTLGRCGDSREPGSLRSDSLEPIEYPVVDSRVPVPVANVSQSEVVTQRKEGNVCSQISPLNIISSLVVRLLRTA